MADSKLTALTETSVIDVADYLYTTDTSDTTDDSAGSSRKISITRLGGYLDVNTCNGRLTTESGVGISTSDRTSQSTIYFTPYNGNRISLYDGTRWKLYSFTERSLALSSLISSKNYDVFLYDNSGTLTLELSTAWTNDTTRNDALTTQDGILVKSGATTRRYLGTVRTTSTTTTEDSLTNRYIWNLFNQAKRPMYYTDSTDHTYSTNAWREWNNTSGTNQVNWVCGAASGVMVSFNYLMVVSSGGDFIFGIALNSTDPGLPSVRNQTVAWRTGAAADGIGVVGYNYLRACEFGLAGGGTADFFLLSGFIMG